MSLYHLHVSRISRSAGQSVVASASYRSGEKLQDHYYGETHDYTHKGGIICSDIMAPEYVPQRLKNRETLWNEVEQIEKHPKAQLAYSFDIALQTEFSMEENIALARQFIKENFIAKGMIADMAVHVPEKDGGIRNPHFHVMCPIRPITLQGEWGEKQHREYILDENGEVKRDPFGKSMFNAVPTTDWGRPETLEDWREKWAKMVNEEFRKKGMTERIDHQSYIEREINQVPQVHEGVAVRQMEKRGIRTQKGNLNRWIREINQMINELKEKLVSLSAWVEELKAERDTIKAKKQELTLGDLIIRYYEKRNDVAKGYQYGTNKAIIHNMQDMLDMIDFLKEREIYTIEKLSEVISEKNQTVDTIKKSMKVKSSRMSELQDLIRYAKWYQEGLPIVNKINAERFTKRKEALKEEYRPQLSKYYVARRELSTRKVLHEMHPDVWEREIAKLQKQYNAEYEKLKPIRDEVKELWKIRQHSEDAKKPQTVHRKQVKSDEKVAGFIS